MWTRAEIAISPFVTDAKLFPAQYQFMFLELKEMRTFSFTLRASSKLISLCSDSSCWK